MSKRSKHADVVAAIDAARAAWPGVDVPADAFAAWMDERLPDGASIGDVRASDLYIACACARNDARAIALFEERFGADVERALRRMAIDADSIDETRQVLRRRFFVGENGERPRIADYSGRGD